jgi:hypothetical protein
MITRYLLCARRAVRDAEENDVSLISVLEDVSAQGFPVIVPRATVVWCLTREPAEAEQHQGTVRIFLEQQRLAEAAMEANFQGRMTTRIFLTFAGLAIPTPGRLKFEVSLANGLRGEYTITIGGPAMGAPPAPGQVQGAFIAM